jgi:hypothetical protein
VSSTITADPNKYLLIPTPPDVLMTTVSDGTAFDIDHCLQSQHHSLPASTLILEPSFLTQLQGQDVLRRRVQAGLTQLLSR